jgi:hypothetical protein
MHPDLPACLPVADSYEWAEDIAMISLMKEIEEMREGVLVRLGLHTLTGWLQFVQQYIVRVFLVRWISEYYSRFIRSQNLLHYYFDPLRL